MTSAPHRLVCLTTSGALGGAETSLLTLLTALRQIEPSWPVTVVAPAEGPLLDRCASIGVEAIVISYPRSFAALGESAQGRGRRRRLLADTSRSAAALAPYLLALGREIRRRKATVIHSNGVKAHVASALVRPRGARLVWHLHDYVQPRPVSARMLGWLRGRPAAVVANSDSVRADAIAALGVRVTRIHNAVDLDTFSPAGPAADLAAMSGMPPDDRLVRIGFVGTFARWKGHDVFLDALAALRQSAPIRGYIVGGPVYQTEGSQWTREALKAAADDRGLTGIVGFTGHVSDVASAMRRLDVVVHASVKPEPFGMVIAEGMAAGRAVVAAATGGAVELVTPGFDAVTYPSGDARALAACLEELVTDPGRRCELGRAARVAAEKRFDPRRMAQQFREVYLG